MSENADLPDGLASLKARRTPSKGRRPPRRSIPASMNPTSLPPYDGAQVVASDSAPATEVAPGTPEVTSTSTVMSSAPEQVSRLPRTAARQPPRKVGLYVDEEHQDYFEAVRAAGNGLRPRVNLSASAVVRLALDRLGSDLTVEQVRDLLVAKPTDPHAVGRKRR